MNQTSLPPDMLLHSGNAGMIIHRVGMLTYAMAREGRDFSVDLLGYMNQAQAGAATTFCYEEVFGVRDRLHWLVHLKTPDAYGKLLEMVDHDADYQDISVGDRLPEDEGGGNWEKMFVEGSLRETILCAQHGLTHGDDGHGGDTFVPPARFQTTQPVDEQLNSANAGAIVLRTADVRYEFRKEGRKFLFDWQTFVNDALPGRATAYLYEQTWGRQDRVHCLIQLRSLDDYQAVVELDRGHEMHKAVYGLERVPSSKGGGGWGRLFVPASMHDVLLVPHLTGTS
jgi:hypothetical protein